jgi:Tol biopolymer transport system component
MTGRNVNALVVAGSAAALCLATPGLAGAAARAAAAVGPANGTITLVSRAVDGSTANGDSYQNHVSDDGRYVVYSSYASDIVPGDTNGQSDVFLYDRLLGTTRLVSHDAAGSVGNDASIDPDISANGKYVVFASLASNLGPARPDYAVFRYTIATDTVATISLSPSGAAPTGYAFAPSISATGRYVAYESRAHNLVPGDHNNQADIFRWDARTGKTTLISHTLLGAQTDKLSYNATVSSDGRYVAYVTNSATMGPADTNRLYNVYLYDTTTRLTVLVSRNAAGQAVGGQQPQLSANGRWLTFTSEPNAQAQSDVMSYNVITGAIKRISLLHPEWPGGVRSSGATLSANGRYIAYTAYEVQLVAPAPLNQIYLFDRSTRVTTLVSATPAGQPGNLPSWQSDVGGGKFIVFASNATDLVPVPETANTADVMLWTASG